MKQRPRVALQENVGNADKQYRQELERANKLRVAIEHRIRVLNQRIEENQGQAATSNDKQYLSLLLEKAQLHAAYTTMTTPITQ